MLGLQREPRLPEGVEEISMCFAITIGRKRLEEGEGLAEALFPYI